MSRIAIINSHPIQYFAPLYAAMNAEDDFDVCAYYMSDVSLRGELDSGFGQAVQWDVDLLKGYEARFMKGATRRKPSGFFSVPGWDLWRELRRKKYDATLVHGYRYMANIVAVLASKSVRRPIFVRGETTLLLRRTGFRSKLRAAALSFLYRQFDGVLAIGSLNAEFYRSLGVPESKITLVPYTVDNERFRTASLMTDNERRALRQELGLVPDVPVVVYASKLQARKHPDSVIRSAELLVQAGFPVQVLLIGSGEMDQSLRLLASQQTVHVSFTGFVNQSLLPRYLGAGDVFVLPSEEEPWGLIVNEAMCAGLPVVVGQHAGCVADLVTDGYNGFAVTPGDDQELAMRLRQILSDANTLSSMSANSRERISTWSYAQCVSGWRSALDKVARPA